MLLQVRSHTDWQEGRRGNSDRTRPGARVELVRHGKGMLYVRNLRKQNGSVKGVLLSIRN